MITIRLTEGKLRNIIKETLNKVLKWIILEEYHQKMTHKVMVN